MKTISENKTSQASSPKSNPFFSKKKPGFLNINEKQQKAPFFSAQIVQAKSKQPKQPAKRKKSKRRSKRESMQEVTTVLVSYEQVIKNRHTLIDTYLKKGIAGADKTRKRIDASAVAYKAAYENHERILQKAKKEDTAEKNRKKELLSIGISIGSSLISAALPPARFAIIAARSRAMYYLAGAVAGALASAKGPEVLGNPPPSRNFKSQVPSPEASKLKQYEYLVDLYRSLALMGSEMGALLPVLSQIKDVQMHAELWFTRRRKKSWDQIWNAYQTIIQNINKHQYDVPSLNNLKRLENKLAGTGSPDKIKLEKFMWVAWLASRVSFNYSPEDDGLDAEDHWTYNRPGMIDIDTIENHLYDLKVISKCKTCPSLLGESSYTGSETDSSDTKRIARLASHKWDDILSQNKHLFGDF